MLEFIQKTFPYSLGNRSFIRYLITIISGLGLNTGMAQVRSPAHNPLDKAASAARAAPAAAVPSPAVQNGREEEKGAIKKKVAKISFSSTDIWYPDLPPLPLSPSSVDDNLYTGPAALSLDRFFDLGRAVEDDFIHQNPIQVSFLL